MRNALLSLIILCSQTIIAQQYLTLDVIGRVFQFKYEGGTGTSFIIHKDSTNYLITAKHILKNTANGESIKFGIFQDNAWALFKGKVYFDKNKDVDIAVIVVDGLGFSKSSIEIGDTKTVLGDEGFFLGFPYGLKTNDHGKINKGFPFPLLKKAVLSGSITENGVSNIILDGHNNPGFSGGPVLFQDRLAKSNDKYYLVGVISSYWAQKNNVKTPFGLLEYSENSGIIIAVGSKHILDIITQINQ